MRVQAPSVFVSLYANQTFTRRAIVFIIYIYIYIVLASVALFHNITLLNENESKQELKLQP